MVQYGLLAIDQNRSIFLVCLIQIIHLLAILFRIEPFLGFEKFIVYLLFDVLSYTQHSFIEAQALFRVRGVHIILFFSKFSNTESTLHHRSKEGLILFQANK